LCCTIDATSTEEAMTRIPAIHRHCDGSIDFYYRDEAELRAQALHYSASWLKPYFRDIANKLRPAFKCALLGIPATGAIAAVAWTVMSAKTGEHLADEISSCAACGHVEWVERQWDDAKFWAGIE
jgi:hypothetical protein